MSAAYRRALDTARAGARPVDENVTSVDTSRRAPGGAARPILVPGDTCWRLVRADRFSVIVDAADYFRAAKKAMSSARRILLAIGWDFDLRIRLEPDREDKSRPDQLGPFVLDLVRGTPGLQAYVLKWDVAMLMTLTQQVLPLLALHWLTMPRIHFRLDSRHPLGACHHQKILVIDDALAFCGGIDMTHDRWDTSEHKEEDPCRIRPDGSHYGPFHDVTTAFDGEAARAMGELARMRWRRAGGRGMIPVRPMELPWPEGLDVALRDVDIAIARTMAPQRGETGIFEIERLYLAAIDAARDVIYLESQYFASRAIRDALERRLQEPDGPEVVVVNPRNAEGWLEEWAMDSARSQIVHALRRADRYGRFAIYYPVNAAGTPIYVHAKVITIDDRLLRIGSSNLNNRSMGFDSECDVAVEAVPGTPKAAEIGAAVIGVRNRLLAEHLGVDVDELAATIERENSVLRAVEVLRRPSGRTLHPLPAPELSDTENEIIDSHMLDPERPNHPEGRTPHLIKSVVNDVPSSAKAFLFGFMLGAAAGWAACRRPRARTANRDTGVRRITVTPSGAGWRFTVDD